MKNIISPGNCWDVSCSSWTRERAISPGCWRTGGDCTGGGRLQGPEASRFGDESCGMGVKFQDFHGTQKRIWLKFIEKNHGQRCWFELKNSEPFWLRRSLPSEYLCSIVFLHSWRRHWKKTQATPTKASRSVGLKVGLAWKVLREQKQIRWFQLEKSGFPVFDGPFF